MQTSLFNKLLISATAATAAVVASASHADAFSFQFGPNSASSNSPATGASALVNFTFTQAGSGVLMGLNITNTTGQIPSFGSGATQATLVGLGFNLPQFVSSYSYNSGTSAFTKLYGNQALTSQTVAGAATLNPFGTYAVGIRSAGTGNFTGGNPQSGLTAGQSTSVSFLLNGSNLVASNVQNAFQQGLSNNTLGIVARFQQVNAGGGSDKLSGGTVVTPPPPPAEKVPEPGMVGGLVVAGLAAWRTRKQKAAAQA